MGMNVVMVLMMVFFMSGLSAPYLNFSTLPNHQESLFFVFMGLSAIALIIDTFLMLKTKFYGDVNDMWEFISYFHACFFNDDNPKQSDPDFNKVLGAIEKMAHRKGFTLVINPNDGGVDEILSN